MVLQKEEIGDDLSGEQIAHLVDFDLRVGSGIGVPAHQRDSGRKQAEGAGGIGLVVVVFAHCGIPMVDVRPVV